MTVNRNQMIALGVAMALVAVTFFVAGRSCDATPVPVYLVDHAGIDAGPGEAEIGGRLDAAIQAGVLRMDQIEDKFDEDIEAFDANQRAEYERLRDGGDLEATARHLSEWSRRRKLDGGM